MPAYHGQRSSRVGQRSDDVQRIRVVRMRFELRTSRFPVVFPNSYPGPYAQKPHNQANFQGSLTHHPQPKRAQTRHEARVLDNQLDNVVQNHRGEDPTRRLKTSPIAGKNWMARPGFEPGTPRFSAVESAKRAAVRIVGKSRAFAGIFRSVSNRRPPCGPASYPRIPEVCADGLGSPAQTPPLKQPSGGAGAPRG